MTVDYNSIFNSDFTLILPSLKRSWNFLTVCKPGVKLEKEKKSIKELLYNCHKWNRVHFTSKADHVELWINMKKSILWSYPMGGWEGGKVSELKTRSKITIRDIHTWVHDKKLNQHKTYMFSSRQGGGSSGSINHASTHRPNTQIK